MYQAIQFVIDIRLENQCVSLEQRLQRKEVSIHNYTRMNTRGSQKVLGVLSHRRFGEPRVRTSWKQCYWSFLSASFTEVARCSSEEVAGRDSGFCLTIMHRATRRLLCSNSCPHPINVLSGSRSELLLAVPCSENGPQGDVSQPWRTSNGVRHLNSRRFQKRKVIHPCFQQWQGRCSKCVCACARMSTRKGPTLKVIR
jgi:hypothetical protein